MSEYIYGKNPCIELIKNNHENILNIFVTINNTEIIKILDTYKKSYIIKDKMYLDKLVNASSQGVVIEIKEYIYKELNQLITNKPDSLIIALDGINDPHNFGSIARTAEICGCDGIIIQKNRSVLVNSTVYKVSTGAIDNLNVSVVTNLRLSLQKLKKAGYWIVGSEYLDKSINFWDTDFKMKIVLVIGSEGNGISRLVREECDFLVKIPMYGKTTSLNASVSAALIIYEIRRQQNK